VPNLVSTLKAREERSVRRIKAKDGKDLILSASSTLTSALLEHGLSDEMVLLVNPVLLGKGKRLFAEGTPPCPFCARKHAMFAVGHRHHYLEGRWTFAELEIRSVSDAFHDVIPKGMDQPPRMPLPARER
jgi:RibD C-terminal domain